MEATSSRRSRRRTERRRLSRRSRNTSRPVRSFVMMTLVYDSLSACHERTRAALTDSRVWVCTVSKYGDRNVTTRTNDLQNPRLLAASSSNEDEKHQLKSVLDECTAKLSSIQEEVRAHQCSVQVIIRSCRTSQRD